MHKTMEEVSRICKMMEQLMTWQEAEIAKGKDCFDCEASGETIDMIKDLAEAKEKLIKAKYYEILACSLMMEDEDIFDEGRMGYDNWKYSSGKFAPKGHGHYAPVQGGRRGYIPYPYDMNPEDMEHPWRDMMRHPLTGSRMGFPMDGIVRDGEIPPYMDSWKDYRMAKRNYTESHDINDAHHMNQKILDTTMATTDTMAEIWKDANPETREKMKANVSNMLKEWERGK